MLCSQVKMSSELSWMYLRHIHLRRLLWLQPVLGLPVYLPWCIQAASFSSTSTFTAEMENPASPQAYSSTLVKVWSSGELLLSWTEGSPQSFTSPGRIWGTMLTTDCQPRLLAMLYASGPSRKVAKFNHVPDLSKTQQETLWPWRITSKQGDTKGAVKDLGP